MNIKTKDVASNDASIFEFKEAKVPMMIHRPTPIFLTPQLRMAL